MRIINDIKNLLDKEINPVLAQHSGECQFIDFSNGVLVVKLTGGCTGCPGRKQTFYNSIKPFIQTQVPEVEEIILED